MTRMDDYSYERMKAGAKPGESPEDARARQAAEVVSEHTPASPSDADLIRSLISFAPRAEFGPYMDRLHSIVARIERAAQPEVWCEVCDKHPARMCARCADSLRAAQPEDAALRWWEAQRTRMLVPVMESSGWRLHEYDGDGLRPIGPFRDSLVGALLAALAATEKGVTP